MANVFDAINATIQNANSVSNTYAGIIQNEAKLSTQNKQIQLKDDINKKMDEIRSTSNPEEWETNINQFFEQTRNDMTNPDSKYYCKNNLQGEMFNAILDEAKVDVDNKVSGLIWNANREKAIVDYRNDLTLLANNETGQNYINKANEMAKNLFDCGYITRDQYQNQLDTNFDTAYINTATKAFDDTVKEAIERGDSKESLIKMALDNVTNLMGIDTDGLPKTFDKVAMNKTLKKTFEQNYNAYLSDYQYQNVSKLAGVYQQLNQATSQQDIVNIARQGQMMMNGMKGNALSNNDREEYSRYFKIALEGGLSRNGSGSVSTKGLEEFEKYAKAAPAQAYQWVKDGKLANSYDAINVMSKTLYSAWINGTFKENYNKDTQQRQSDYDFLYSGRISEDALTQEVFKDLKKRFPTTTAYLDNDCSKLISEIKKNPDKFGPEAVAELAYWINDTALGADKNYDDVQFLKDLQDHINNCYVSKCEYAELNDKGNLKKTFNAKDPKQIAQAARVAGTDYVFNYNGKDYWAPGTEEALTKEGGVVNVLQSAVRSTLDVPENVDIAWQWQRDEQHNDMTSTPIFTVNNKNYQVIPNEGDDGFKLAVINPGVETRQINNKVYEVHTDKNGNEQLQEVEYIEGKVKDYAGARAAEKDQFKAGYTAAHDTRTGLEDQRIAEIDNSMKSTTTMPKAMEKVWGKDSEQWKKTQDTIDARQKMFHDTEVDIEKAAQKVKNTLDNPKTKPKNQMQPSEFEAEYGIDYYTWAREKNEYKRYELILNSK